MSTRECGTCTKCCDGWLSGSVNGYNFGIIDNKRVPCNFVLECVGCKIYDERPKKPCQNYKCEWLVNKDVPEHFKPDTSNVLVTKRGNKYYELTNAGEKVNSEVLEWWIDYVKKNNFKLSYYENNKINIVKNMEQ